MRNFATYSQKRKAAARRKRILYALCAAVVLGAGWVLMRPAITLSDQPECGLAEHTHTEDCYRWEAGPAPLTCGLEYHEHGDGCYDAEGNLLCEAQEHIHTESCYGEPETWQVLSCETPEHTHTDDCYSVPEPTPDYTLGPVMACGMAEHVHGEGCYDGETLICTIPEHTHTDSCTLQTEPTEETEPSWDSLTETEKRQELLRMLHIETDEDAAAFDALLVTYHKTLDEIHTLLLENTLELVGDEAIVSLQSLRAYLEAAAPEEPTAPTEEPLSEEEQAALEEIHTRLSIETDEDRQALLELLKTYDLKPSEILEYLKEMEEDPEAEQVKDLAGLRALIESVTAVETLEAEDGTFYLESGSTYKARLVQSGYSIEVTVHYADPVPSDYHVVADIEAKTEDLYENHGAFKNGYTLFNIGIVKKSDDQMLYTNLYDVSYTIQKTDGTAFTETSVFLNDVYENKSGEVYSEDKKTISGSFEHDAANSYAITPVEILLANDWELVDDTFLTDGGSYTLAYILNRYNVFLEEDYTGSHVVGPVIVGGKTAVSLGGLSLGNAYGAPHTVPNYIGDSETAPIRIVTANEDVPTYFGQGLYDRDTAVEIIYAEGKTTDNYWYARQYVDFTAAWSEIAAEIANVRKDDMADSSLLTPNTSLGDTAMQLPAGNTYTFAGNTFAYNQILNLTGVQDQQDTTIILTGTDVTLPWIHLDGTAPDGKAESGSNSGVVFICPDAVTVKGNQVTGHLVAPNARVEYRGGYYNGCVIAKSLDAEGTEGHMWPYNGKRLIPAKTPVQARKYMNGVPLTEADGYTFTFGLYLQSKDEDGKYVYAEESASTGKNVGETIVFDLIPFSKAGTYVYRIVENMDKEHPGIIFDAKAYYAKIEVTGYSTMKAEISYFKDEDCTIPLDEGTEYPIFNNRYGEKLPDTGGSGTAAVVLPGVGLMALALLGAILQRKRRAA